MVQNNPEFIIVDLFCGAGGTTTGFAMSKAAKVIACVNHDPIAIKSHWANHPEVAHFEEDIRTLPLSGLKHIVKHHRKLHPNAKLILWASLECTNFSKAKGGQPRDADSRTLADHLDRYIFAIRPDYIQIENVVEFMCWGPLDDKGKPISRRSGANWLHWRNRLCSYGYRDEWRELNSADFGAYTSRNRLFGCFAKEGLPIKWPQATHSKKPSTGTLHEQPMLNWMPVKEVLDFSDEGNSIFGRKKELSEKTLERIYAGLIKYVAGGKDKFILKYNSTTTKGIHHPPGVDEPCPTIACQNRLGIAFIKKYYSGRPEGKVISVNGPAGALTTSDHHCLVNAQFLASYYTNGDNVSSVNTACPTITTVDRCALIQPKYLVNYHHSSSTNDLKDPCPTLTCKDKLAIIQTEHFITRDFSGGGQLQSIEQPAGTIMAVPKLNKVQCVPFVMPTNFSNGPKSVDEPCPTVTASRKHHYLVNPSYGGNPSSVDAPCPVIVARQDKSPLYFIEAETGNLIIPINEDDTPAMKKIKEFMQMYGLIDIKMRMLKVPELLKIQGFPADYVLEGNQSDQKKFIGNSVVPLVVFAWIEAMAAGIKEIISQSKKSKICTT
jgi:DNA (cytosine-5)-methyltransferase 1